MNSLALIVIVAIFLVLYSLWSGYKKGEIKGVEMRDFALTDYMKVKAALREWKADLDSIDARNKAIAAAQFFNEVMKDATFSRPESVKTKEDAFRFTYLKHFAHLKSIDEGYVNGDMEFIFALHDITYGE